VEVVFTRKFIKLDSNRKTQFLRCSHNLCWLSLCLAARIIFVSTIFVLTTESMRHTVRPIIYPSPRLVLDFNAQLESFISKMEANSGVKFHEAQIALAREWIGDQADAGGVDPITEVNIKIPQATGEGIVETKAADKVEKVKLPASAEEARRLIARFERGADNIRGDEEVADTVSQHMLNDKTGLMDEKWLGTEDEERDA
jgi:hypothetical protein